MSSSKTVNRRSTRQGAKFDSNWWKQFSLGLIGMAIIMLALMGGIKFLQQKGIM